MAEGSIPGASVGWEWFEEKHEQVEAARNEDGYTRGDMFRIYLNTFTSREGAAVLSDLKRFRRTTAFDPARGFYDGAAQGFYNSGINDMVTHIEKMIAAATQRANDGS